MATCGGRVLEWVTSWRIKLTYENVGKRVSDPADVGRLGPSTLCLAESHVHGELDRQTGHRSSGQGLDFRHGFDQPGFGAVSLQGHLQFRYRTWKTGIGENQVKTFKTTSAPRSWHDSRSWPLRRGWSWVQRPGPRWLWPEKPWLVQTLRGERCDCCRWWRQDPWGAFCTDLPLQRENVNYFVNPIIDEIITEMLIQKDK